MSPNTAVSNSLLAAHNEYAKELVRLRDKFIDHYGFAPLEETDRAPLSGTQREALSWNFWNNRKVRTAKSIQEMFLGAYLERH